MSDSNIPSFSDSRVFLVAHDKAIPGRPLDWIGHHQTEDGPTYVHVGIALTDDQLQKVWEERRRFPELTLEQLKAVRDRKVSELQIC